MSDDIQVLSVSPDRSSVQISWGNVRMGFQKFGNVIRETSRVSDAQVYDRAAAEIPKHKYKKIYRQAAAILLKINWQSEYNVCPNCQTPIPDDGDRCPNCEEIVLRELNHGSRILFLNQSTLSSQLLHLPRIPHPHQFYS